MSINEMERTDGAMATYNAPPAADARCSADQESEAIVTGKITSIGYSGTPLAKKLGLSEGATVCPIQAPTHYRKLLEPVPPAVRFRREVGPEVDVVHLFVTQRSDLEERLSGLLLAIRADAAIWISWPKKAAKVATDVTEDVVREVALPLGLVDIKVCAVDETWSGLKLVIRKSMRTSRG
jgi:hypothetical protein